MTNKEAISNLEELYPVVSEEKKQAIDKAIEALKLSDEVEEASKRIGTRYYGPDNCSRCKHYEFEKPCYCDYWGIYTDKTDTCNHYTKRFQGGNK